ncbi:hypothetical protein VTP01DRAFT_1500 [Rhizomucor pusillus]|uniref:uncharacterized protein n=1 Tax=Rhizomucor pusillus TaxID=4840 RepID=UPI003744AACD
MLFVPNSNGDQFAKSISTENLEDLCSEVRDTYLDLSLEVAGGLSLSIKKIIQIISRVKAHFELAMLMQEATEEDISILNVLFNCINKVPIFEMELITNYGSSVEPNLYQLDQRRLFRYDPKQTYVLLQWIPVNFKVSVPGFCLIPPFGRCLRVDFYLCTLHSEAMYWFVRTDNKSDKF